MALRSQKRKFLWTFIFLILLVWTLNLFFWKPIQNRILVFFQPAFNFWRNFKFLNVCPEAENLISEIQNLKEENQELLEKTKKAADLKKENDLLKRISQVQSLRAEPKVLTRLLFRPEKGIAVLDAGEKDKVKEKMSVLNEHGFFCGWIKKTTKNFSYLEEVEFVKSELPVKIGEEEIPGVLIRRNGAFWIDLVPQDRKVKKGDFVVSKFFSNGEIFIPENFLLGKVDSVKKNDLSSFQEIKFSFGCREDEPLYLILLKDYEEI